MKNPLKQMKQVQGALAVTAYEVYLAGVQDGRGGGKMPPLKSFCREIKAIVKRGREMSKKVSVVGEGHDTADAAQARD